MQFAYLDIMVLCNIYSEEEVIMTIWLKTLIGRTIPILVEKDFTVLDVMKSIEDREGIPVEIQSISYQGIIIGDTDEQKLLSRKFMELEQSKYGKFHLAFKPEKTNTCQLL